MTNASEEIAERKRKYSRIERATDVTGRTIGVKRLTPSQQLAVQEMAPNLDGYTTIVDEKTGAIINIPKSSPLIVAASVCEIEGIPVTFPQTRGQLNAVLDRLDQEGLAACYEALSQFATGSAAVRQVEEVAKN